MTARSDSGESISEATSISMEEFVENSPKIVSFPPLETDFAEEMTPEKQVKSSPFASVSEKDGEIIQSDSVQASFSETSSLLSKEPEAMNVDSPQALSLPETGSTFLEEPCSEISKEGDQFGEDDDMRKIEEVVGSVVSISETLGFEQESLISEKKEQDCDAQRLLEAEKRRLLAEIEVGSIFKKMVDVDSKEHHETKERVRVKDNAFVGRSMKIELVDDTALLNVVPFYKKGKDHHPKRPGTSHADKDAPRKHKKVGEKPVGEKKDKGNASTKVSEFQNRGDTNGKQLRIMYSRKQMESMRFAHVANQKKLWSDMYAKLLPELVSEYEGLVSLKNQKTSKANQRESGIGILGTLYLLYFSFILSAAVCVVACC
ncbi:unnamed protein product [Arabis nemorensis]|uniref:Uncharacterized protein n=1 Tax=Arabis nemorensis TaxID=586526 RepID=A0A565BNH0_9BRAS|nr:unnamed protein product [Arabis nemorensis]